MLYYAATNNYSFEEFLVGGKMLKRLMKQEYYLIEQIMYFQLCKINFSAEKRIKFI